MRDASSRGSSRKRGGRCSPTSVLNRERTHSREQLASPLWPERDDESARRNLLQAMYNLKETLPDDGREPLLLIGRGAVQVNPAADLWLDVVAFRAALRHAPTGNRETASHRLVEVTNLYRGELLAGFFSDDCDELREWLVALQASLREAAGDALRALVQSTWRAGSTASVSSTPGGWSQWTRSRRSPTAT